MPKRAGGRGGRPAAINKVVGTARCYVVLVTVVTVVTVTVVGRRPGELGVVGWKRNGSFGPGR